MYTLYPTGNRAVQLYTRYFSTQKQDHNKEKEDQAFDDMATKGGTVPVSCVLSLELIRLFCPAHGSFEVLI